MKRTPKYFYLCTNLSTNSWLNSHTGDLISKEPFHRNIARRYIGTEYWPFTRAEARARLERTIMQFENKPPYKFVKIVR